MSYRKIVAVAAALPVVCVIAAGTAALIVVEVVSGIWRAGDECCPKQETKPKQESKAGVDYADWN